MLAALPISAQLTPPVAGAEKEKALELSVYRVSSSSGTGYIAKTTTSFKTKQQIGDIPRSIFLMTRDLLDDIGWTHVGGASLLVNGLVTSNGLYCFESHHVGPRRGLFRGQYDADHLLDRRCSLSRYRFGGA